MAINSRIGSKVSDIARKDLTLSTNIDPGPFIGKIKDNADPAKLGRLRVYIPELASGFEEDPTFWRTVTYSSPFFGTTVPPVESSELEYNKYGYTKQSYGMWATPPDIGSYVICIFIGGDPNRGYYIGCLPDPTSHHMVPGNAGSKWNTSAGISEETDTDLFNTGAGFDLETLIPTAEFNDKLSDLALATDYYKVVKPMHDEQLANYIRQGLIGDRARGPISSSSQRESPSQVYGISTPGRKIVADKDDEKKVFLRQGGHSFVMDDGDAEGDDNLVRIRTSAGHQIMMNDTEGTIHIINASGKNWIEMGADGSIRAFAEGDISMHSKGAINFKSDKSFNVEAPTINMRSFVDTHIQCDRDFRLGVKENTYQTTGKTFSTKATAFKQQGTTNDSTMSGNQNFVGAKVLMNSGPSVSVESVAPIPEFDKEVVFVDKTTIPVVPTHEPWVYRPEGTTGPVDDTVFTPDIETDIQPETITTSNEPSNVTPSYPPVSFNPLTTQPDANGAIGPLDKEQVTSLFSGIGARESGGNYNAVNSLGYSGKYQMGVAALEDLGYVKPGSYEKIASGAFTQADLVKDASIWTGKDGINSQEDFLASQTVQESAMYEHTISNYNTLTKIGAIRPGDDASTVGGMIQTAHLLGAGGAKTWRQGGGGTDAYGTEGGEYYALGSAAVTSVRG